MAYTKVFAIRARLDDRVKYAVNGEKTELDERIVYTADPEKTDTVRFVTTLNCRSAETAFAAISATSTCCVGEGGKSRRPSCPFPSSGRSFIWSGMSSNSNTFYQEESLPRRSWSGVSACWSGIFAC